MDKSASEKRQQGFWHSRKNIWEKVYLKWQWQKRSFAALFCHKSPLFRSCWFLALVSIKAVFGIYWIYLLTVMTPISINLTDFNRFNHEQKCSMGLIIIIIIIYLLTFFHYLFILFLYWKTTQIMFFFFLEKLYKKKCSIYFFFLQSDRFRFQKHF